VKNDGTNLPTRKTNAQAQDIGMIGERKGHGQRTGRRAIGGGGRR
jgi:hypothetical protein